MAEERCVLCCWRGGFDLSSLTAAVIVFLLSSGRSFSFRTCFVSLLW